LRACRVTVVEMPAVVVSVSTEVDVSVCVSVCVAERVKVVVSAVVVTSAVRVEVRVTIEVLLHGVNKTWRRRGFRGIILSGGSNCYGEIRRAVCTGRSTGKIGRHNLYDSPEVSIKDVFVLCGQSGVNVRL